MFMQTRRAAAIKRSFEPPSTAFLEPLLSPKAFKAQLQTILGQKMETNHWTALQEFCHWDAKHISLEKFRADFDKSQ
jgi:hypothetical protein